PLADLLAQVLPLEHQPFAVTAAALYLHRRGRTHRGVDRQVAHLLFGLGANVSPATVGGLARRALASLLSHTALARKVDAAEVEGLQGFGRRFMTAGPACRHPRVGAGRLLAGLRGAGRLLGAGVRGRLALRSLRLASLRLGRLRALLLLSMLRGRPALVVAAHRLPCPVRERKRRGVVDVLARWGRMA